MSRPNAYTSYSAASLKLAAAQQQHPIRQQQQQPAKLIKPKFIQETGSSEDGGLRQASVSQRKLFRCLYAYAILLVALYALYALYCLHLHHLQPPPAPPPPPSMPSSNLQPAERLEASQEASNQRLEAKVALLERYLEVLAVDLEDTRRRLAVREKCDCRQSCHFNGTQYADQSSWQHQCDTCRCLGGRVECQARKCPQLACDDPQQLPGQCCPQCPRRCHLGKRTFKHGQHFRPDSNNNNNTADAANKLCLCQDGRIKCEPMGQKAGGKVATTATTAAAAEAAWRPLAQNGTTSSSSS